MKYHGIKPVYNVWLSKDDGKYFGPGVAMLIEGVKRTGSLSSAAKEIGMAYSKAWRIIKRSEELTGCKLLLSRTGGAHGGGAFSGKDSSKVDRSAAYAARHIAKNLVAAGVADEVLVELSYAIGIAQPLSIYVDTYRSPRPAALEGMTDGEIARRIGRLFDLRPAAIVKRFGLKNPIFEATASYGHFGNRPYKQVEKVWENGREVEREIEYFGWEKLDAVDCIRKEFGL